MNRLVSLITSQLQAMTKAIIKTDPSIPAGAFLRGRPSLHTKRSRNQGAPTEGRPYRCERIVLYYSFRSLLEAWSDETRLGSSSLPVEVQIGFGVIANQKLRVAGFERVTIQPDSYSAVV